ncbi:MAG: peptidylprolyl isomerase, partial [Chthoniobacterales bacterium]
MLRALIVALLLPGLLTQAVFAAGPIVARFQSVLGDFDVLLNPLAAPISVSNFTAYANRGAYDTTIIHRSTTYKTNDIQVVQGGGFKLSGNSIVELVTDPPIPLESGLA